jgi:predicted house-cleaning noncanonical NTP pyrophosphatase (MazG superfamily)
MKQKDTKNKLIKAFKECMGIIKCACEKVGTTRQNFNTHYRKDEEFKKAIDDILEEQIDYVESKMLNGIEKGNDKLIQFYLRTRGKHRGWGESTDITSNGETINTTPIINIQVINPKQD